MLPRIKGVEPIDGFFLIVDFDDGTRVKYDVNTDMREIPSYSVLKDKNLFNQVQLDSSRTCVFWNEEIDLPSDSIYEYGNKI